MFSKKKKVSGVDECAKTYMPMAVKKGILDLLRDRRTEKIKQANDLDRDIASLTEEIGWLERHPMMASIIERISGQ